MRSLPLHSTTELDVCHLFSTFLSSSKCFLHLHCHPAILAYRPKCNIPSVITTSGRNVFLSPPDRDTLLLPDQSNCMQSRRTPFMPGTPFRDEPHDRQQLHAAAVDNPQHKTSSRQAREDVGAMQTREERHEDNRETWQIVKMVKHDKISALDELIGFPIALSRICSVKDN